MATQRRPIGTSHAVTAITNLVLQGACACLPLRPRPRGVSSGLPANQVMALPVPEQHGHDDYLDTLAMVPLAVMVGALRQAAGRSGR